ncbi:hypothetical protein D3C75_774010 [compost metagenome]
MLGQGVDVGGHVHGDDIGGQAVDDCPRLLARAAVGHIDLQRLAAFRLPVFLEGGVVVLVEVTHHIVRGVEQGGGLSQRGQGQSCGEQGGGQESFHCTSLE